MKITAILGTASSAVLALAAQTASAADIYPNRPVRIIVAYTPAGTTDILARVIGQKMNEAWGQQIVVDNRPGANGNIGTELAAKATPDGYTLLMATAGTHGINPTLYTKLAYDALKDFEPVSLVAIVPNILVVNNSVPAKSVKEFIEWARSRAGQINYGSPGNGSTGHLSTELLKSMTGIKMTHIPYKGSAPTLADLMGGQIQVVIDNMPPYLPQVKAGRIRALAVSPAKRSPAVPDLPTIAEAGVPGYDAGSWFALYAPAKTPKAIVTRLSAETARILKLPDVSQRLSEQGAESVGSTPEQLASHTRSEIAKWAKVIKDSGARAE